MTEEDEKLLEALGRLNTAITTFCTHLVERRGGQDAHIRMAVLLLDAADQILKHLLPNDAS